MQDWVNSPSVRNPAWEGKCTCLRDPQLETPREGGTLGCGQQGRVRPAPWAGGQEGGKGGRHRAAGSPLPRRRRPASVSSTSYPLQGRFCDKDSSSPGLAVDASLRGTGAGPTAPGSSARPGPGPGREGAARPPGATSLGRRGARTPCSRARCSPSAKWGVLAEIGPCPLAYREPPALVLS